MSSGSTSRAPTEARGAARRREILEATLRVIGRGGLAAVDHRAVAAEAGVPLGSTTYYFSSKEDIVSQALAHAADTEADTLVEERARLEAAPAAEVPDRLADMVAGHVSGDRFVLLAHYELYLESARREELRASAERWDDAYADFYALALEKTGTANAEERARLLCVALDGLVLQHVAIGDDVAALRARALELVRLMAAA